MCFASRQTFTWHLRSRTLSLGERTRLMAIVNLTPDSFSGDSDALPERGLHAAIAAIDGGADIVDLGAESTRPGATPVSAAHEQARLLPVLEALLRERPSALVSVDTYHAATARAAARAGAQIINDVSGLDWDQDMAAAVAETHCGLVLMHTRGHPQDWRSLPPLRTEAIVPTIFAGLCERLALAEAAGIGSAHIVLDPGFGFGKAGSENVALLAGLARLHELGRPLLVGMSRKGFLGNLVHDLQPDGLPIRESRRMATAAAGVLAVTAGVHILRVHDVQAARETIAVVDAVLRTVPATNARPAASSLIPNP